LSSTSLFREIPWKFFTAWDCGRWWVAIAYNARLSRLGNFINGGATESVFLDSDDKNNATSDQRETTAQWNEQGWLVTA